MQVCFDKLMLDRPVAVHFDSREEAEAFFLEMKRRHPERVRDWSHAIYPRHYNGYGGVCYCPYFSQEDVIMKHGDRYTYEVDHGYQVVEFKDLLYDNEIEINATDLPVEFLFV